MSSKVASWSICIYCWWTLLVDVFALLNTSGSISPIWIYHTIILLVLSLLSGAAVIRLKNTEVEERQRYGPVLFVAMAVFATAILRDLHVPHFWLDEYTQLLSSMEDPVVGGLREQQPPGAYLLTKTLMVILGPQPLVSRLVGFIPMLISLYFFLAVGARARCLLPFAGFLTTFYMYDLDVHYVSLEGRAVGLGVASMSVVVLAVMEYIRSAERRHWVFVMASSYIFLSSVVMQPPILLGLFGLVALIVFWRSRDRVYLGLVTAFSAAVVLFVPIQMALFEVARKLSKFNVDLIDKLMAWGQGVYAERWAQYFLPVSSYRFWFAMAIISTLSIFLMRKGPQKRAALAALFFAALFVPVFDIFYHITVNWTLNRWYFSCYMILVVSLMALTVSMRLGRFITVGAALLFFIVSTVTYDPNVYRRSVAFRADWQGAFERVVAQDEGQRVYVVGYCSHVSWWCYSFYVGAELWTDKKNLLRGQRQGDRHLSGILQDNGMVWDIDETEKRKVAVLVYFESDVRPYLDLLGAKSSKYDTFLYDKFVVVETKEKVLWKEEMPLLLSWIIDRTEKGIPFYYPYELMVWYYAKTGNAELADEWRQKLLALPFLKEKAEAHSLGAVFLQNLDDIIQSSVPPTQ